MCMNDMIWYSLTIVILIYIQKDVACIEKDKSNSVASKNSFQRWTNNPQMQEYLSLHSRKFNIYLYILSLKV